MYGYQQQYQNQYLDRLRSLEQPSSYDALIRVTGIEGAKAYQMPPNSTAVLFDGSEDLMFIKTTDGAGFPTIRVFTFAPKAEEPKTDGLYATKQDVEDLRKLIEEVRESNGKQPVRKSAKEPTE